MAYYYDNWTIQVFYGKTGWCWTRTNPDGTKSGGIGFASREDALQDARST